MLPHFPGRTIKSFEHLPSTQLICITDELPEFKKGSKYTGYFGDKGGAAIVYGNQRWEWTLLIKDIVSKSFIKVSDHRKSIIDDLL